MSSLCFSYQPNCLLHLEHSKPRNFKVLWSWSIQNCFGAYLDSQWTHSWIVLPQISHTWCDSLYWSNSFFVISNWVQSHNLTRVLLKCFGLLHLFPKHSILSGLDLHRISCWIKEFLLLHSRPQYLQIYFIMRCVRDSNPWPLPWLLIWGLNPFVKFLIFTLLVY